MHSLVLATACEPKYAKLVSHKIYYMKIFCWIICIAEYISQVRRQRGALGKLVEEHLIQVRFHMGGFVLKQFEHG